MQQPNTKNMQALKRLVRFLKGMSEMLGHVQHLHTQVLRVQEAVARRELTTVKVLGIENPADVRTKHLAQRETHECFKRAGCRITGGRSRMALRVAQGLESAACGCGKRQVKNID